MIVMLPPAVGYYTDASQDREHPFYDPGLGVPCPFCMAPVDDVDDMRTLGLMAATKEPELCVFYRCHSSCHDGATEQAQATLDRTVIAMLHVLATQIVVAPPIEPMTTTEEGQ